MEITRQQAEALIYDNSAPPQLKQNLVAGMKSVGSEKFEVPDAWGLRAVQAEAEFMKTVAQLQHHSSFTPASPSSGRIQIATPDFAPAIHLIQLPDDTYRATTNDKGKSVIVDFQLPAGVTVSLENKNALVFAGQFKAIETGGQLAEMSSGMRLEVHSLRNEEDGGIAFHYWVAGASTVGDARTLTDFLKSMIQ